MLILQRARREGKTTELVRLVRENHGVLLVLTRMRADRLAQRYGLRPEEIMTWNEATQARRVPSAPRRPVFIDDLDQILGTVLYGRDVAAAALSESTWQQRLFRTEDGR